MKSLSQIMLLITAAMLLVICGKSKEPLKPVRTLTEITAEGWALFEVGSYSQASAKFTEALEKDTSFSDAYNGRGWCRALQKDYQWAITDWQLAVGIDANLLEPCAGLALVYNAVNEYDSSITYANKVLSQDANFVFSHNSQQLTVNAKVLRLVLAQSLFYKSDYTAASQQLDIVDPAHAPHSTDPAILVRQIQDLWGAV